MSKLSDKLSMFALLNLIREKEEAWDYDLQEELGFSNRQFNRAKKNLKARFSYEILIKNQKFKVIPIQESLV